MHLNQITDGKIRSSSHLLLDDLMRLLSVITEGEPAWAANLSDELFVPPKQFDKRRRSRRFLNHLKSLGVPVDKWLANLDDIIPGTSSPESVAGGVGRAYFIGDLVVKITPDIKEAKIATLLVGKNIPFLSKFYDAWEIAGAGTSDRKLYALVQEKLSTGVSGKYRAAGGAVYSFLDHFNRPIEDPVRATKITVKKFLDRRLRPDKAIAQAILKLFTALKAIFEATGILLQDTHGANIAFKGREVGFFDLGRSSTYDRVELPTPKAV